MPSLPDHLIPDFDPYPNPAAVVRAPNLRVTLLTSRLLRLEYSPDETFEDRPSQVFWYRKQPPPAFETNAGTNQGAPQGSAPLEVATQNLELHCEFNQPLSPESLSILIKAMGARWRYGDSNPGNLGGTVRTLDKAQDAIPLEPGLISRDGWALVDDTPSLVFDRNGWLVPRDAHPSYRDLYFFGYGRAYQECLRDFRKIAGPVPLIPRWTLGNWWSRYWAYTQEEIQNLVLDFERNQIPLSVWVIDMDWHITDTGNTSSGWTGYTWNRDLFPDPGALLDFIHQKGLKTTLNLHPAGGIHPHEVQYLDFARRMGIDPESEQPIPFDLSDPRFARAYFELLHHPYERMGVDFWWIDWQQGRESATTGLDPLWWLNHLHFYDHSRQHPTGEASTPSERKPADGSPEASRNASPSTGQNQAGATTRRPLIISRWGGLGNHRYPVGFSGDTVCAWDALDFLPEFTATAANVGYGWWSHDIGGHFDGSHDPERFTRWVQYGLLSPVLRLHSTNDPTLERRPFAYNPETYHLTTRAMQLRHALIPYLYSMAWRDHHEALPLTRPLYHLHPAPDEAYHNPGVYTFGTELIAAPHTQTRHPETGLSRKTIWLPGEHWGFFNGWHYPPGWHILYGDLAEIPLFAKPGAIVPLANWRDPHRPAKLVLNAFPGASNRFELYEDDGETNAYQSGAYAITPFELTWEAGGRLRVSVHPVEGDASQVPPLRAYEFRLPGIAAHRHVALSLNGAPLDVNPSYSPKTGTLIVPVPQPLAPTDTLHLDVEAEPVRSDFPPRSFKRLLDNLRLEARIKNEIEAGLPHILANPARLDHLRPALQVPHLRALLETLTRAGVDWRGDRLLLFNQSADPHVTYTFTSDSQAPGAIQGGFHLKPTPVPQFQVLDTTTFGDNPPQLRLQYYEFFHLTLQS